MDIETLRYLWTADLDPLFWRHGRVGVGSAWYGHVPFAHWIVRAVKPGTLVELGTHNGVSYSAFCEAVLRSEFDTRCYAVDTWRGDDHAEHYGEEVYWDFRRFHDGLYGAFSELLRCTFDDALRHIPDTSVDLLHIDGFHTYEAVKHDFDNWRPKLSDSAVVLLHDTNVRERDFGVWRLWEELRTQFPCFEFLHGHGLGVLAVGRSISPEVNALCSLRDPAWVHALRERFSVLGERWILDVHERLREGEVAARDSDISSLKAEIAARDSRISSLEAEAARHSAAEAHLRARARQRTAQARAEVARPMAQVAETEVQVSNRQPVVGPKIRLLYVSGEPDSPGNLYRVERYVEAATAAGAQASWIRVEEIPEYAEEIAKADILVIWRAPWDERVAQAVAAARSAGARVVFDVDDLMFDCEVARLDVIDGIRTQGLTEQQVQAHYTRIHTTMVAADYCTAPTEELAARLRRFGRPALVLPNGFDSLTYQVSRRAVRRRRAEKSDGLLRIGYAGGSRTHQRDFQVVAEAIVRVLRERSHCRLVLFRSSDGTVPILELGEFPVFQGIEDRIEWHNFIPLTQLPEKIAHFDINLAPLEVGNVFCEAKSELKYFEAALVDVPTVASPTGPYRRAIRDGVTGFLADHPEQWYATLLRLVDDPALRSRVARAAHNDAIWRFGPLRRVDAMLSALPQLRGDTRQATRAFAFEAQRAQIWKPLAVPAPQTEIVFEADKLGDAEVTVVIPLHNYVQYIEEALESVRTQTLEALDLIVVSDLSTDTSLSVALNWVKSHASRFNRVAILRNRADAGLGPTRNAGIDAADTPWVLPLDADNRLRPECCKVCLSAIRDSGAAFVYPQVQKFGESSDVVGNFPFDPARFIGGNFIDAMALISKEAWAAIRGYQDLWQGWEDFDFWCRLVEEGLWGSPAGDTPLAESRVDGTSMLCATNNKKHNPSRLITEMEQQHRWLNIVERPPISRGNTGVGSMSSRLSELLPILRCPETGKALELGTDGVLRTVGSNHSWPLVEGRPNLFPGLSTPEILSELHLSNPLPKIALTLIEEARDGLVLNLSAGGTNVRFNNVVEAEAAVFRHTDLLADAHRLPFTDRIFDAVIALNAFEHFREPKRVARELFRVLRPGGKVLIRTAFLQPLHEKPWHFYNCTRYGLEEWFKDFETEELHVSDNFSPGHSISWIASECEAALRRDGSSAAADAFTKSSMERFIALWRNAEKRETDQVWSALGQLPQVTQEAIAAGFQFVGRRPPD
jgi:glycosyltransferase involved in cell wall biosynthesis/SAM-dependent methyltransferase